MQPTHRTSVALLVVFLVGAISPGVLADAESSFVTMVVNDVFDDVDMADVTLAGSCGGGALEFLPQGNGFRFFEIPESTRNVPIIGGTESQTGGYESTGCGTASYPIEVPAGIDHLHIRFTANRTIDELEAGGQDTNFGIDAEQSLHFDTAASQSIHHYFQPDAGSSEPVFVDPPLYDPPTSADATVSWYFEDRAAFTGQNVPNTFSGISYQAIITDPEIEYSFLPADNHTVVESTVQAGTAVVRQSVVVSQLEPETVDRFDRINVRVQTTGTPQLVEVILPDGSVLNQAVTRQALGPQGYDPDLVLVEHFGGDVSWFTVPYGIVAEQGAGDYTFVIQQQQNLVVSPVLVPFAAIIILLPLVASAFAIQGTMRFRQEAFGGFRRAATWLVVAIGVLLGYYLVVMLSALVTGSINRMAILPFDAAAWLLYAQVTFAAVGFVVVFVVGRELYRITVPRKPS